MKKPEKTSNNAAPTFRAGRPALSLTVEQAERLAVKAADLVAKHSGKTEPHREFVLDFVRAVFQVTGQTFSAAIYRKLLQTYSPGRGPSTATIQAQKNALLDEIVRDLAQAPIVWGATVAQREADAAEAARLQNEALAARHAAMIEVLNMAHALSGMVARLSEPGEHPATQSLRVFSEYLFDRLVEKNSELASLRSRVLHESVKADEFAQLAADRAEQITATRLAASANVMAIHKIIDEMASFRITASCELDEARDELKAARAQVRDLEELIDERQQEIRKCLQIMLTW